jgi:hypothetical protein
MEIGNRPWCIKGVATDVVARLFARGGDETHRAVISMWERGCDKIAYVKVGMVSHWCSGFRPRGETSTVLRGWEIAMALGMV